MDSSSERTLSLSRGRFSQVTRDHLRPLVAALALPAISQPASGQAEFTTAQIAVRAVPATTTVIALGENGDTLRFGSGFFVSADGTLVTNWHVLAGASDALVLTEHAQFRQPRVLAVDSMLDVAVLQVHTAAALALPTRRSVPAVGERVVVVGSPMGLSQTVVEGIVSAFRKVEGRELVQISAPISPGSSGGPVLDTRGRAFAIATSYVSEGQLLAFSVPLRYALDLLTDSGAPRSVAAAFGAPGQDGISGDPQRRGCSSGSRLRWSTPNSDARSTSCLPNHGQTPWPSPVLTRPGSSIRFSNKPPRPRTAP